MYILQSILANANAVWLTETLPMPLAKADKLIRVRIANATGNRRFRLVQLNKLTPNLNGSLFRG